MGEVHPLLNTILGKEVPIAVVGRGKALKCFSEQLRKVDSCNGWQCITMTNYHKTIGTQTMRMVERCGNFWFLQKLGTKDPNYIRNTLGGI